jgi:hypothetical protein
VIEAALGPRRFVVGGRQDELTSTPRRPIVSGSGGSGTAAAPATGPIALSAPASRGVLALTLTNTSPALVTVATHVIGGKVPHYGWLTVELEGSDGRTRTLAFVEPPGAQGCDDASYQAPAGVGKARSQRQGGAAGPAASTRRSRTTRRRRRACGRAS